jgi:hypothetical protein
MFSFGLCAVFFTEHLQQHRAVSPRTIVAYRDTFRLLLAFAEKALGREPQRILLADLNAKFILAFLDYLETERLFACSMVQPDMVKNMRADKVNPDARWLVAAYDAAHPPIAAGNPPLTRLATDAWTELFCFIRNQSGAPHMDATQAVKDSIAHTITESWAKSPPEEQKFLSEMPHTWALVHFAWVRNKGDERQRILAARQPVVNPSAQGDPQQVAATEAMTRSYAFTKRDAATVSDPELLQAAKDADLVALQFRRAGGPENLGKAARWEDLARLMRAGKAEYLTSAQANTQQGQNAMMEEYLKTQVMIGMLNHRSPGLSLDGTTVVMRPRSNTSPVF